MKKKIVISAAMVIVILIAIGITAKTYVVRNFNFRNSEKIVISTIDDEKSLEIINENDKKFIEDFCSVKNAYSERIEMPACFFDTVKITITKNGKTYTVFPSADDCENIAVKYGNTYFYHSISGKTEDLIHFLRENGFSWEW